MHRASEPAAAAAPLKHDVKPPDHGPPPSPLHRALRTRSRVVAAIRRFFEDRDFLEVDTPVRLAAPALELNIHAEPAGDHYLRTSPELHMKRLLAEGFERIYQIGPCFRRGEQGPLHNPEFTMLEWYRLHADYMDMLVDTKALTAHVVEAVLGTPQLQIGGRELTLFPHWKCMTVQHAFRQAANWDVLADVDADRFDLDMVDKVEPWLPRDTPVVLMDYPAEAGGLARTHRADPRAVERWELYMGGIELANAFSELTDPAEQRKRFEACARARAARGEAVYPIDQDFLGALERGLPPCGGVAFGLDRFVMLLAGAETIHHVRAFSSP